jgi:FtsP/CotA-like multicopper oxidase with cupredoxin domain
MSDRRWGRGLGALLPALTLLLFALPAATPAQRRVREVREYWIAAVPVTWNVVPNERDAINEKTFLPEKTTFQTVVYRAFTPNWETPLPDRPRIYDDNDGIPGPTIHARVGDEIVVHFKNLDTLNALPHSMHFHGVHYQFGSDGSYIPGFSGPGGAVKPGDSFTYHLQVGPDSVGVWPYHDHTPTMMTSIPGGMYGAISILGPDEKPPDHEFVVFFESQLGFMTINGHAFVGNTPVFRARVGEIVQWDVLALGDEHHTFHLHGHRWRDPDGTFIDTRTIGPAESFSFRIKEDVPGTWLYHCHVEGHMARGMIGIYVVSR